MRYVARVRRTGIRKYKVLPERESFEQAMRDLTRNFDRRIHKRGDVIMISDWYDGVKIVEIVKR